MMLSEFWQAVVSSAVISTIISNLFLWWHKKNDYKRDYYKKIIDKRLNAYEKLKVFIGELEIVREILSDKFGEKPGQGTLIHDCFFEKENLNTAIEECIIVLKESQWFSKMITQELLKINNILANCYTVIYHPTEESLKDYNLNMENIQIEKWFFQVAIVVRPQLENSINKVIEKMNKDILNLDEVETFFENRTE